MRTFNCSPPNALSRDTRRLSVCVLANEWLLSVSGRLTISVPIDFINSSTSCHARVRLAHPDRVLRSQAQRHRTDEVTSHLSGCSCGFRTQVDATVLGGLALCFELLLFFFKCGNPGCNRRGLPQLLELERNRQHRLQGCNDISVDLGSDHAPTTGAAHQ